MEVSIAQNHPKCAISGKAMVRGTHILGHLHILDIIMVLYWII